MPMLSDKVGKMMNTMKRDYIKPEINNHTLMTGIELMIEIGKESAREILAKRRINLNEEDIEDDELETMSLVEEKPLW